MADFIIMRFMRPMGAAMKERWTQRQFIVYMVEFEFYIVVFNVSVASVVEIVEKSADLVIAKIDRLRSMDRVPVPEKP
jgi:hypothetical protein